MNKYIDLTIEEIHNLLTEKKIKPIDLVNECFERIEARKELNAFITLNKESAVKEALKLENIPFEEDNLLFGIPIAIKDNIVTKDLLTTCGSKILSNFIPIYDATVIKKIEEKHMIIIGKTNMDEFAMGSTSETSYFGAPLNPHNQSLVTGGSSGGSASCVSARLVPLSLGSDTGGSIRQPASYCGIVGMKPTYGRVSRYGVVAFGSSLDQLGPMTRTVKENANLLNVIAGHDEFDLTSSETLVDDYTSLIGENITGMKIGVVNYFMSDIVSSEVRNKINETIKMLEDKGAIIDYVDIDYIENAVNLYQIIAMGEASSNLARFDGVRYGYRTDTYANLEDMYKKTRAEGFGDEVKRRIMVGSYLLSGENAKIYYDKAMRIRDDIKKSFEDKFNEFDLLIGPTTTTTAPKLGEGLNDPMKSFLDDILVIPVNMAGLPALSLPVGFSKENMPIGLHIIGKAFDEKTIYKLAYYLEQELSLNLEGGK